MKKLALVIVTVFLAFVFQPVSSAEIIEKNKPAYVWFSKCVDDKDLDFNYFNDINNNLINQINLQNNNKIDLQVKSSKTVNNCSLFLIPKEKPDISQSLSLPENTFNF